MNTEEFKAFVNDNSGWFSGDIQETIEDIRYYENEIGFELPEELKWLLIEFGYSESCGIDNLSSSVMKTTELRESIDLPENVFILVDWDDAGVVLMMAGKPEIIKCDAEDVSNFAESGSFPKTIDIFENYPAWVEYRLQQENEESEY